MHQIATLGSQVQFLGEPPTIMNKQSELTLSAHQPNFFPWFGFFEKIIKSDVFLFSDDVKYSKQQLTSRIHVIDNFKNEQVVSVPIDRKKGSRLFEKHIHNDPKQVSKIVNKVLELYYKSAFFNEVEELCQYFLEKVSENHSLSEINISLIKKICLDIGIENKVFYKGSELGLQNYKANERIFQRAKTLNIWTYLYGQGASGYQDNDFLRKKGLKLIEIDYKVTKKLFPTDFKYSIIHQIACYGKNFIKDNIQIYR